MKADQLRKSILQMAIQGKLVPQDPNDEPASVLLEKIRAEKDALIKQGKIKKEKPLPPITDDEKPFDIPDTWEWVRLSTVAYFELGKTPYRHSDKYWSNGKHPWFSIADMIDKREICISKEKISDIAFNEKFCGKYSPKGTLLMSFKLTVGRTSILGIDATHNEAIISLYPYLNNDFTTRNFLLNTLGILVSYVNQTDAIKGATLNSKKIQSMLIPLPPFNEQKRIVKAIEKFEPLLAEYDKLEQQATKLDSEIFDKIKKSVLQYAIQGKLVPQDPNDEPASVLLAKIKAEKESLIKQGKIKKEKPLPPITDDEKPFDIPDSWEWGRLGDICEYIHRGKSPKYGEEKKLPIIAQKCNQWDKIWVDRCLFSDISSISKYNNENYVRIGDILVNSTGTGTVGRTGIVKDYIFDKYKSYVVDSHITLIRTMPQILNDYIYRYLISPIIQIRIEEKCSGSTNQIELATNTICNYVVPIPPLNEQKRIVARIEEIFAQIDKIKG